MVFLKTCLFSIMLVILLVETGTTIIFPKLQHVVAISIPELRDFSPYSPYDGLNLEELVCLQQNIYFEGRNQTGEGMAAIGLATINRLVSPKYPDTICGVITQGKRWRGKIIYQKCQYSWFCDRLSDVPNLKNPIERLAWEHSGAVALEVLTGQIADFTGGATHYHYFDMPLPYWARVSTGILEETIRADDHIFYKMIATAGGRFPYL